MLLHEKLAGKTIVLASKSPRRQELIKGLDIPYEIRTKEVDESWPPHLKQQEVALYICEVKANAFEPGPDEIIITSDTIVVLNDRIIEKPADVEDAKRMLRDLSGNVHTVYTAVCLRSQEKLHSFYDATQVHFRELTEEEVQYYADKYQPLDKAGAYGVQEWIGYVAVERMEGSYFTVMGFPVHKVYSELLRF